MNKRFFLIVFLPVILSLSKGCFLFSQTNFKAGLLGGFTATQYDGDSYANYNKLGFVAGAFSRIKLNTKWNFQFEITYFQKGARRYPVPSKGDFREYSLKLDYAEVPLILQVDYKKFILEFGLAAGFLVRNKEIVNEIDITGDRPFGKTDFSLVAGLSYQLNENWEVCSRYSYSILPVRPHAGGGVQWFNRGEYNNCLSFELRYVFGKKEESQ